MLSGCATKPTIAEADKIQSLSTEQRTAQLQQNKHWKIQGKIAFIQQSHKGKNAQEKRESASISWQVDDEQENQTLNLTSYLGINVLHLSSKQGQHLIKVDGEEYTSDNLPQLIYRLTGLTLPTEALSFWLKGLAFQSADKITFNTTTQLPLSLTSFYHNTQWQISYDNYRTFQHLPMATKFTIKKDNLIIKIAIKKWSFTDSAS